MEIFQWLTPAEAEGIVDNPEKLAHAAEEVSDVLSYLLGLCDRLGIDLADSFFKKQEKNAAKYPKERFFGIYGHADPKLIGTQSETLDRQEPS